MDGFHWPRFLDTINAIDWSLGPLEPGGSFWDFVTGSLIFADDGTVTSVDFAPINTIQPSGTPDPQPDGDYRLDLVDAAGVVVASRTFAPYMMAVDQAESGEVTAPSGVFVVPFETAPAYDRIVLSLDGQELVAMDRSPNAPSVSITSPTSGQVFGSETVEIAWSASDVDDNDLTHLVQYSTDGGATYETVAIGYVGSSVTFDRSSLAGSSQARIRVTTSDGTRSTTAESEIFTVVANPPTVTIVSPEAGASFTDLQAMSLEASASDVEDGSLPASSIQWSSDLDGPLGAGGSVIVESASLTPGVHQLTATATDSSGTVSALSVTVTVGLVNEPPLPVDDEAFADLGEVVDIDVLANDSDPDDDLDESSLSITISPSLGSAVVVDDLAAGPVVRYTPGVAGVDSLTYEICDSNGQCSTAVVTITVGTDDCTLIGTEGPDVLVGTAGDDVICGLGGADVIRGLGGDDVIRGGKGNDTIRGGPGDDIIYGGRGADELRGGSGQDQIRGGRGADVIIGGSGNDELRGGKGGDTIEGRAGNDTIYGGAGADLVSGDAGADVIRGGRGADVIHGGRGGDELFGGRGADEIRGDQGWDYIAGRRGADTLYGGSGRDELRGGRGNDTMFGGNGADKLRGGRGFDSANGGNGVDSCRAEIQQQC